MSLDTSMTTELPSDALPEPSPRGIDRKTQLIEVAIFLFLIVPSMALSFLAVKQGSLGFAIVAVATILRDGALISLILYFIWRNAEPLRAIGWTLQKARQEAVLGAALFVPFFVVTGALEKVFQSMGFTVPSTPTPSFLHVHGAWEYVLGTVLVVVVAIGEETIFRGYLMLRIRAVTGSAAAAVFLSAFVFSLGHGYEGSAGVLTVGVMGAIFAIIYLWRDSLVAPIVMHFLQDFIGIVLVPLLASK
ncbi:MAG: CPBP family intramembrane glutamic endopeptidase [Phycisphaerae bacterium]